MDFDIPATISQDLDRLRDFIQTRLGPDLSAWTQKQQIPDAFFHLMGENGWYGFKIIGERLIRGSALREAMITEELAKASPGVAIVALAHVVGPELRGHRIHGRDIVPEAQQAPGDQAGAGGPALCGGDHDSTSAAWAAREMPPKLVPSP